MIFFGNQYDVRITIIYFNDANVKNNFHKIQQAFK